jgi:uncharacterized protein with HEPN domain
MRPDQQLLHDIHEAAVAVDFHTVGLNVDLFSSVRVVRSAALHELTVIGEAAARLSPELRNAYPDVPWSDIIGFRHIIVHGYFGLNWERVCNTIVDDIPILRDQIAAILAAEFPEEAP